MIYTRFGSEIEIIAAHVKTGNLNIKHVEDGEHGQPVPAHISELKADGGIEEINEAIEAITK